MNKIHLSADQRALCKEFLEFQTTKRATSKEYEGFQKRMRTLDKARKKPKRKSIPNTTLGFESNEIKLDDSFDALKDLPEGFGAYSMYDSGGNHQVLSAGRIILTNLWNHWGDKLTNSILLLTDTE
jgi:hypothetical protein